MHNLYIYVGIRKNKRNEATSPEVLQVKSDLENQGNLNDGFNNQEK